MEDARPDPEALRWRLIETWFEAARAVDPERRQELLESSTLEPELLAEVRSLLSAHEGPSTVLDRSVFEVADALDRGELRRVGPYELLRQIDAGGTSVVYEARRVGSAELVAVKLLYGPPDGLASRSLQREAEVLDRLDHPSIAKLIDVGTLADGAFVVTELVRGRRLDHFLAEEELDLEERLRLFVRVCVAIAHAHERGVVHRDLKPANILVVHAGDGPLVKVLDFGLARQTAAEGSGSQTLVQTGQVLGTLAYMSPEQAVGRTGDVGTHSDVYSLGVVLYEMLTGRLPYELEGLPLPEAARVLAERAPRPPSRFAPELAGDLENVLLHCLHEAPRDRYTDAAALQADVERYLAGHPVLARPPRAAEQLLAFARRHRLAAAAAIAFLAVLTSGVVFTSTFWWRAERARRASAADAQVAREVVLFLQKALAAADPLVTGAEPTVTEFLAEASDRIAGDFADRPHLRAALHGTIGSSWAGLGELDRAEGHLTEAIDLSELEGSPETLLEGALLELGAVLDQRGEHLRAEAVHLRALDLVRDAPPALQIRAAANRAANLRFQGRLDEARDLYESTLASAGEHAPSEQVFRMLNDFAGLLSHVGDYERAEALYRRALEVGGTLLDEDNVQLAFVHANLGTLHQRTGALGEASGALDTALAACLRILGEEHPMTATILNNRGDVLRQLGRLDGAERDLREALAIRSTVLGDDHPHVASTWNNLALVHSKRGSLEAAEECHRQAVDVTTRSLGPDHPQLANHLTNLGTLLRRRGDVGGALDALERAADILGAGEPVNPALLERNTVARAEMLIEAGDETRALAALDDLVARNGTDSLPTALRDWREDARSERASTSP